jgi:hypothetical protein
MRASLVTLVVATAIGAMVGASHAQENPKAAAAPPPGVHKKMPLADSAEAKVPESPGTTGSGPAQVGTEGAAKPGTTTHVKSFKQ